MVVLTQRIGIIDPRSIGDRSSEEPYFGPGRSSPRLAIQAYATKGFIPLVGIANSSDSTKEELGEALLRELGYNENQDLREFSHILSPRANLNARALVNGAAIVGYALITGDEIKRKIYLGPSLNWTTPEFNKNHFNSLVRALRDKDWDLEYMLWP